MTPWHEHRGEKRVSLYENVFVCNPEGWVFWVDNAVRRNIHGCHEMKLRQERQLS